MKVIKGYQKVSEKFEKPVISIGNFDGVHRGHREILQRARSKANQKNGTLIVYTFRPHPQLALRPDKKLSLLSTYDEKLKLLEECGVDVVIEEPFSRDFSNTEPQRFFTDVLLHKLSANAIVVGYDFGFGKGREGRLEGLQRSCQEAGVEIEVVSPQRFEGEVASSSAVRQALGNGMIEEANHLLGYSFFYRGTVMKGEGRGRAIGFPTANLSPGDKLTLPFGVYVTRAVIKGKSFPSVTNIGIRPTFEKSEDSEREVLIETHVLEEKMNLYGVCLAVQFLKKIRDEKKFSGIEELKSQISADVRIAKASY
jgi:riboflavin kinase / FMN adenylyltransferase